MKSMERSRLALNAYRPNGEPGLLPSGVLFLDVMGVELGACREEHEDRLEFLQSLRSALEEARSIGGFDEDPDALHVRALFSDSLIAGFPLQRGLTPEDIIHPAEVMAARLQLALLSNGFFLRGGLSFGEHYMDEDFAFGPALVEAAMLERKAVGPRVVLSSKAALAERAALEQSEAAGSPQRQYLITDADGITFISYLDVALDLATEEEAGNLLDRHRLVVSEKLREHAGQPRIESKYLWAARYHNYVCSERAPQPVGRDHMICLDGVPAGLEGFAWDLSPSPA